ncbi:MAG: hypothetical protein IKV50_00865, partial [Clostridia bacterium]|nr:hypothetical protein [Clostridia bacterium]
MEPSFRKKEGSKPPRKPYFKTHKYAFWREKFLKGEGKLFSKSFLSPFLHRKETQSCPNAPTIAPP